MRLTTAFCANSDARGLHSGGGEGGLGFGDDAIRTEVAVLPPISWPGTGFFCETRAFDSGDLDASGEELFDAPPVGATAAEHTVLQLPGAGDDADGECCVVRHRVICTFTGPPLVHAAAGGTVRALARALFARELLEHLSMALQASQPTTAPSMRSELEQPRLLQAESSALHQEMPVAEAA